MGEIKLKNKKDNNIVIVSAVISLIIGVSFFIYFLNYCNIKLTTIISIAIAIIIIVAILYVNNLPAMPVVT